MKASLKWLCYYVDIADVELRTLAEAMTKNITLTLTSFGFVRLTWERKPPRL